MACNEFNAVKLLISAGADPFIQNEHGNKAIDYVKSQEVEQFLTHFMLQGNTDSNKDEVSCPDALNISSNLPDDVEILKQFILETLISNYLFTTRSMEAIRSLVEEKHLSRYKLRLLEEAIGVGGMESDTFMTKLQKLADENEHQTSTIFQQKMRISKLKAELTKQQEFFAGSFEQLERNHQETIQSLSKRNEEQLAAVHLIYEKRFVELHLTATDAILTSKSAKFPEIELDNQIDLKTELDKQIRQLSKITAEKAANLERLNYSENLRLALDKENQELRSIKANGMQTIKEHVISNSNRGRKSVDVTNMLDKDDGKVIFISDENGMRIKAATTEKLIDHLLHPQDYGIYF